MSAYRTFVAILSLRDWKLGKIPLNPVELR